MNSINKVKDIRLLDLSENRITDNSLQSLYNKLSLLTNLEALYLNSIYIYIYYNFMHIL